MKKIIILLTATFVFFSCEKELDISDFGNDFSIYESELRIEGIIYPAINSAIVRIDQSFRLDEANLYDCIDDDLDWNYYFSAQVDSSFESLQECQGFLGEGGDCTLHLYACVDYESEDENEFLWTFTDRESCLAECPWYCITDDTGSDGMLTPTDGEGIGFIQQDEDGSENNGVPDCGEANVDEYNEILPNIHVSDCEAKIINNDIECPLYFNKEAGRFFDFNGKHSGEDYEIVNYGGFIPDSSCIAGFFQNYNTEYHLIIECPDSSSFSRYGKITATDTIRKPPISFHPDNQENILNCANELNVYECLNQFSFTESDTLIFLTNEIPPLIIEETNDTISQNELLGFFDNIGRIDSNLVFSGFEESNISYSALYETRKFQSVQYMFDEYLNDYVYVHSHPDGVTDSGEFDCPQNKLCTLNEQVVVEQFEDNFLFKYMFYTFSEGIDNYYFYDMLDIADPVRTNIRDGEENPIMGGFGSMASETVHFYILTPEDIHNLYLELN